MNKQEQIKAEVLKSCSQAQLRFDYMYQPLSGKGTHAPPPKGGGNKSWGGG